MQEAQGFELAACVAEMRPKMRLTLMPSYDPLKGTLRRDQAEEEAEAEVKKLKKDMNEFKNNKDGKTEELKVGRCAARFRDPLTGIACRRTSRNRRLPCETTLPQ